MGDRVDTLGADSEAAYNKNDRMRTAVGSTGNVQATMLDPDYAPSVDDVICARGRRNIYHAGNQRFRAAIEDVLDRYSQCKSKLHKSLLVVAVVADIRRKGRFIREVADDEKNTKRWFEVGDKVAREKVGQAIREALKQREKRQHRQKDIMAKLSKSMPQKMPAPSMSLPQHPHSPIPADRGSSQFRGPGAANTTHSLGPPLPVHVQYESQTMSGPRIHQPTSSSEYQMEHYGTPAATLPAHFPPSHRKQNVEKSGESMGADTSVSSDSKSVFPQRHDGMDSLWWMGGAGWEHAQRASRKPAPVHTAPPSYGETNEHSQFASKPTNLQASLLAHDEVLSPRKPSPESPKTAESSSSQRRSSTHAISLHHRQEESSRLPALPDPHYFVSNTAPSVPPEEEVLEHRIHARIRAPRSPSFWTSAPSQDFPYMPQPGDPPWMHTAYGGDVPPGAYHGMYPPLDMPQRHPDVPSYASLPPAGEAPHRSGEEIPALDTTDMTVSNDWWSYNQGHWNPSDSHPVPQHYPQEHDDQRRRQQQQDPQQKDQRFP